jgi:hypothetical protein
MDASLDCLCDFPPQVTTPVWTRPAWRLPNVMAEEIPWRDRTGKSFYGQDVGKRKPADLAVCGSGNLVLVLLPAASSGGCGLLF